LVESGVDVFAVANSVFPQMLQALDCIAWKGIVHRDVKPENILYISQPDAQYQFQLGDFGLCNRIIDAATFAGSRLYMPPEMFQEGDQTHKVDVWSRCYGYWMQESFVRSPIGLRLLRRFSGRFCLQPLTRIRFQRFGIWQLSTPKNVLLQHRCLSSTSTEQDSALHGIRSQLSPPVLLPQSLPPELRPQLLPP